MEELNRRRGRCEREDELGGFQQIADAVVGRLAEFFDVTALDEKGRAAGGMAAVDVAPAVSDEIAAGQVNAQGGGGIEDHAGGGFAAAGVGGPVIGGGANFDPVHGDGLL